MDSWFKFFAEHYATYGYPILFIGVLLENAAVPVPGETAVIVASFLASPAGGHRFNLVWVIGLAASAAVLGDNLGFWLGHRFARPRLQGGRRFLFLTPDTLRLAQGYFERYGIWTVFFARFVVGLRVVAALAAGIVGMPWPRFVAANAAGALAWAVTIGLLGYFFGNSWDLLHRWLGHGALILLGCFVLLVGLPYLLRWLRRLVPGTTDRLIRNQLIPCLLLVTLEVITVAALVLLAQGRHPTIIDREVRAWLSLHQGGQLDRLAGAAQLAGSLPVLIGLAVLMLGWMWRDGRPWREQAALVWAVAASEAVGLLLAGLLHHQHIETVPVATWPFGFAGLIPLRAAAFGCMAAYLVTHWNRRWGLGARALAGLLILLAGFGVVATGEQTLTEALLEGAAGGLVFLAGVWWLQGLGPGLLTAWD